MPQRNRRFKHLFVLVVAQIGCLGVGFWLHHRFVVSSLAQAVRDEALTELAADAEPLLAAIDRLQLTTDLSGPGGRRQLDELFRAKPAIPAAELTLVDVKWRVVHALRAADADGPPSGSPGETLKWIASADHADDPGRMAGSLVVGDSRHVAVGRRLPAHGGYLLLHSPVERIKVTPAALLSVLPGVGVVTWCLASVLVVLTTYLIITKLFDGLTRNLTQTEAAALKGLYSLVRARDAVIFGLAKLSESRDETTGHHLERIASYASRLAASARHHPKYREVVTPEFIELIGISSALHDIGKVGIEDSILLKPGTLTQEEWVRMKEHTTIGGECLLEIERHLGSSNFLQMAREIALSHHERWDGTGYPQGLAGEEIPLAARIVAVADVYDALSTRRPYKQPMPHRDCVAVIQGGAGTQFDAELVESFLNIEGTFRQVARQYADGASGGAEPAPVLPDSGADWQEEALVKLDAVLKETVSGSTSSAGFG